MNKYGGYISILNSSFTNFTTCGAIIRNKKVLFSKDILKKDFSTYYEERVNNYQY